MLIRACASFPAMAAKVPGRFSSSTVTADSSLKRYFAFLSASLAGPSSLTRMRILPRPAVSGAQSAVMLTPAAPSVRASLARTPSLDSRLITSCVVLGMTTPPAEGHSERVGPQCAVRLQLFREVLAVQHCQPRGDLRGSTCGAHLTLASARSD